MADAEPHQADRITIDLSDRLERNRYRCPRGHTSWEPTNGHFWCSSCARDCWDVDPVFHELVDARTRDLIQRDGIRFVETGCTRARV